MAVANSLTGNVSVLLDFDGTAFASIQHIWTGLSPRAWPPEISIATATWISSLRTSGRAGFRSCPIMGKERFR